MLKRWMRCVCVLLCVLAEVPVQAAMPLSDRAKASVITCGPGDEFYLTFGHTALRIYDPELGIDYAYNYGTFDFSVPHFYWRFVRGRLDYRLSRTSWNQFLATYDVEQRAVWEQPLALSPQEVCNLYLLLEANYLPENRYYRYDFFRDNCATRVRDMVEAACGKHRPELPVASKRSSYRNYVHQATGDSLEWWTLGVDVLLGLPADKHCSTAEAMFYPIVMQQAYAHTLRKGALIASESYQWLEDHRRPHHRSFPPTVAFAVLFLGVALIMIQTRRGRCDNLARWVARVLFVVAGIVGLFLLFMWFGTDHSCTAWNLNILWASPLLLLIAIRMERSPKWALWLQLACFAGAVVWVLWCGVSLALIPIVLTLSLPLALLLKR